MKKTISVILTLAFLLSAFLTISASAITVEDYLKGYTSEAYKATYGTPIVDGVKDSIYDSSDTMVATQANKDNVTTSAEYWMAFNRTTMFIYCHVHDETLYDGKDYDSNTDGVDFFIDMVDGFKTGETDAGKGYSEIATAGQFRVDPNLTPDENLNSVAVRDENNKVVSGYDGYYAKAWGEVAKQNGANADYEKKVQLATGIDEDKKGYWFEIAFDFTKEYQETLATKLENGENPSLGFALMVNEADSTNQKRTSYVVSNNCRNINDSTNKINTVGNCKMGCLGEVILDVSNYKPVESLGAQMKTDGSAVRMVYSVDSLKYENMGFEVTYGEKKIEKTSTTVYSSVYGYDKAGAELVYTAKGLKAQYLVTLKVTGIPTDGTFEVKPFVTDAEGTKTYGKTVKVTITGGALTDISYVA